MTMPKDKQKIEEAKEKMRLVRKGKTWEEIFGVEKAKIVIEIDGTEHNYGIRKEKDRLHYKMWKSMGYQVFRIPNKDVNEYMEPLLGGLA